jgi:hypothetical protein
MYNNPFDIHPVVQQPADVRHPGYFRVMAYYVGANERHPIGTSQPVHLHLLPLGSSFFRSPRQEPLRQDPLYQQGSGLMSCCNQTETLPEGMEHQKYLLHPRLRDSAQEQGKAKQ